MKHSLFQIFIYIFLLSSGCYADQGTGETEQIHSDFERKFIQLEKAEHGLSGWIQPGWNLKADDQSKISLRSIDDPYLGFAAQRINIHQGRCSLKYKQVYTVEGKYVLFSIALRSLTATPVVLQFVSERESKVLWENEPDIRPEWRIFKFVVPQQEIGQPFIFQAIMDEPGTYDFDELTIKNMVDDYERQVQNFSPPLTKNILQTSSFPDGVHSYWTTGFDKALSDKNEIGPTGVPALLLTKSLTVPPFVGKADTDYTFSFYARSKNNKKQQISISIVDVGADRGKEKDVKQTFTITDSWQRYAFSSRLWPSYEGFYFLNLDNNGHSLYLDGLQLEQGYEETEFQRTGPIEVTAKTDKASGLFTGKEKLTFSYCVYGDMTRAAKIRYQVSDILGATVTVDKIIDEKRKWLPNVVTLDDTGLAEFGTYRLLIYAVNEDEQIVSRKAEVLLHRVHEPRMANQKAPDSPFGIHINPMEEQLGVAKKLGFNWVRAHNSFARAFNWYFIEQEKDKLDFSHADKMMERINRHQLMMLGTLETAPPFYTHCPDDYDNEFWRKYFIFKDEYIPQWQRYCKQIVSRYKDDITNWELWNEPMATLFFKWTVDKTGRPDKIGTPEDFANMAKVTYPAVKEANPNSVLIGQTTRPRRDDLEAVFFHEKAVEAGLYNYVDAHAFHGYGTLHDTGFPNDKLARFMRDYRSIYPPGREIAQWDTEGSFSGSAIFNYYTTVPPDRMDNCLNNAKQIVRYYISIIANGYEKFFVYTFHSVRPWMGSWSMLNPDYSLPPHAASISHLAWQVEGKKFVKIISPTDNIHIYVFKGDRESVGILLPKGYVEADLAELPNSIHLHEMYGNAINAPTPVGNDIFYLNFSNDNYEEALSQLKQLFKE